jgi:hypothetical protein
MRNPIKLKYADGEGGSRVIRGTGNKAMTNDSCSNKRIASNMINSKFARALQDKEYKRTVKK